MAEAFRVTASGTPRNYRWQKDGVDIDNDRVIVGAARGHRNGRT